jgi:glycosyl transferase, family 25
MSAATRTRPDASIQAAPPLSVSAEAGVHIRVISLPGLPWRDTVEEALAGSPVPWSFFDARSGADPDLPYDLGRTLDLWGRELSRGEIGCFASHAALLREFAAADGPDWLLVLEDDVLLDRRFPLERLVALSRACGLTYVRLYSRYLTPFRHVAWFCGRQIVRFEGKPLGTQAYLISRAGAASFLASVSAIERPIDHEIDRAWANGLTCYALYPHPALEFSAESTVVKVDPSLDRPWRDRARTFTWRVTERLRRERHNRAARESDRRIAAVIAGELATAKPPAELRREPLR